MSRIVVVGGGIVGLSVVRAALKRGHEAVLLEQGAVPNPQSASHDQHRMIRPHYGAALGYTRMVAEAFGAWDRVWADTGETQFENSGAIAIAIEPGDYGHKTLAAFRTLGLPHEVLDRSGVERLMPYLALPAHAWGVVAGPAGPLFAGRIVADLARWIADHGAEIRSRCKVAAIDADTATAILADGTRVRGDHLVIAAGAWLPKLLPERYADSSVYRQALVYVEPPSHFVQSWREGPAIATIGDTGSYTLPDLRGAGLKFGWGGHRRPAHPDDVGFASDLASESRAVLGAFEPYLRDFADYRPIRMQVGYYVLDASRRFKVDQIGRAVAITNCDGQMFKFGPLIGERVTAALDGDTSMPDVAAWAAGHSH